MLRNRGIVLLLALGLAILIPGCGSNAPQTVVVYTALDEMYSQPVLKDFEERTGIKVDAVYDTEASKTTGLVTRLIAERSRPRADVFWNNEVAQTILLKKDGVLDPYASPQAMVIPDKFKGPEGYWTGFAARGRVIIYNIDLVREDPPTSIMDFTKEQWRGKTAIAKPLFGTTATHAAALFALLGEKEAGSLFYKLKDNDVKILAGNATVRDMVARGEIAVGLTDTDDANGGILDGFPVDWLFPDQGPNEMGTLLIPNSVALIKNGPNPDGGKALIDYLLSPETEKRLAEMRSIQIPLNPAVQAPMNVPKISDIKTMGVSFEDTAEMMVVSSEFIQKEFLP